MNDTIISIKKLLDHLYGTVYEGMLKLGSDGKNPFTIYYDLDLLNYLIGYNFPDNSSCFSYLKEKRNALSIHNIPVQIALEKDRFKFCVSPESLPAINERGNQHGFLKDIISLASSHHYTLEDVKAVFLKYSEDYTCEQIDHGEFQYVLYFNDEVTNHYKYCFTFDDFGGYYHRLLDYDYQKVISEV